MPPEEQHESPQESGPDRPTRHRDLDTWERIVAGLTGALLLAAGVWVLLRAKNDAQFAVGVMVVGGAVLLIMAVQGTPLIRVGAEKVNVGFGGRQIADRILRVKATKGIEAAAHYAQGVVEAAPEARTDPSVWNALTELDDWVAFDAQVKQKLLEVLVKRHELLPGSGNWAISGVRNPASGVTQLMFAESSVLVLIEQRQGGNRFLHILDRARGTIYDTRDNPVRGLLIVTDGFLPTIWEQLVSTLELPFAVVDCWPGDNPDGGTSALAAGLIKLAKDVERSGLSTPLSPGSDGPQ